MTVPPPERRGWPAWNWSFKGFHLGADGAPVVMSILNVTPDSFSDGGRCATVAEAVRAALVQRDQGAAIVDIGGESTRPGAKPVDPDEESRRVVPVIEELAREKGLILSVDTRKALVARRALEAGAHLVNDVTGLGDPEMAGVVSLLGAGLALMHIQGEPGTMQDNPSYTDVCAEVADHLSRRLAVARSAGIQNEAIALDPGIGFGKTYSHNVRLLGPGGMAAVVGLGRPVLLGVSRKSYLKTMLGRDVENRLAGTLASLSVALSRRSAQILRVHDVPAAVDLVKVWRALDADA
jgi:dihydropteroate synthase